MLFVDFSSRTREDKVILDYLARSNKASGALELELLKKAVSCQVGAGNQTRISWKSSQCSLPFSFSPALTGPGAH